MALFKKIFGGKQDKSKTPKGFVTIAIAAVERQTEDTVKVVLSIPEDQKSNFKFIAGQYITFAITVNGEECRRSYSICSGVNEPLAVAVKQVKNGKVSTWFNTVAEAGTEVLVGKPEGSFILPSDAKNVVAIAAGSGITPILSIAKSIEAQGAKMNLYYGSRTENSILFKSDFDGLNTVSTHYYLSAESKDGYTNGRIDKDACSTIIKADLDFLKADCFLLCGPEQLIVDVVETLKMFGVDKSKIIYELFTTPVLLKKEAKPATSNFKGKAKVTIHLDGDVESFELSAKGKSIVDEASGEGLDVPYSCKGGVCSACKAKIIKGEVTMDMNYSLTDQEVEEGYILTCQAHPASEELEITYDV
ncbi:MAG: 2Fe-2S iron-sulfur cluster-binding protein [Crocinitomicaceae bacterium]|nr:2Fe-2S iron-sulfur cluster-binding protein [Crocinitomicaceae bacterium]